MPHSSFPLLAAATDTGIQAVWSFMERGGWFMVPLGICSFVGLAAILYKFLSLSRGRVIPDQLARDVVSFQDHIVADRVEPILNEFEKARSSLARLSSVVIRHRGKPQRDIILAVEAASREESARLHAGIGVLEVVITVAPLLGLLGTASGLVTIFEGLGDTADNPSIARGIARALNTTIFGLSIAVPCVVAHGYFIRRIEVYTARLETLLADLSHVCQRANPRP